MQKIVNGEVVTMTASEIAAFEAENTAPAVPRSVSRRQFKMQLSISGLAVEVDTWVAAQPELVRIAYAESGSFVRNDPTMQAGFSSLGFSDAEIDAFFTAAASL